MPPYTPPKICLLSSDFIRAFSLGVRDGPAGVPVIVFITERLIASIFILAEIINIALLHSITVLYFTVIIDNKILNI